MQRRKQMIREQARAPLAHVPEQTSSRKCVLKTLQPTAQAVSCLPPSLPAPAAGNQAVPTCPYSCSSPAASLSPIMAATDLRGQGTSQLSHFAQLNLGTAVTLPRGSGLVICEIEKLGLTSPQGFGGTLVDLGSLTPPNCLRCQGAHLTTHLTGQLTKSPCCLILSVAPMGCGLHRDRATAGD